MRLSGEASPTRNPTLPVGQLQPTFRESEQLPDVVSDVPVTGPGSPENRNSGSSRTVL
ncbi:hypothetical protein AArcMg_0252 [Natrarchaeobaculum sulfurireducens]|uniref:Uncharacterized protein n=1 Tax=Natrarchaeobaculum sulfurireducens TaxID=2044521 RepID=A0A346PL80_9EURY|nr:hypothetical protein AArcMg_0252 [Natrarchaeobaculum sulfurireducens]